MLAGSAEPPVAIEDPDYAAMAQRYFDGRSNVEDQKTSTAGRSLARFRAPSPAAVLPPRR
jgi:hypothetical protein